MASIGEFSKLIAEKLAKQLAQKYSVNTLKQCCCDIVKLNADRTKGVSADGTTVNVQPQGLPGDYALSCKLHGDLSLAKRPEPIQYSAHGKVTKVLVLYGNHLQARLEAIPQPPLFYIYDLVADQRYILEDDDPFFTAPDFIFGEKLELVSGPDPVIVFEQTAPDIPEGYFGYLSPDGKYLTITNTQYTTTNYKQSNETNSVSIKWRIYSNIKLNAPVEGKTEGTITWSEVQSDESTINYDSFPEAPPPPSPESGTTVGEGSCYDFNTGDYLGDFSKKSVSITLSYDGGTLTSNNKYIRAIPKVIYMQGKPQIGAVGRYFSTKLNSYSGTSTEVVIYCGGDVETNTQTIGTTTSSSNKGLFYIDKLGESPHLLPDYDVFSHDIDDMNYTTSGSSTIGFNEGPGADTRWFCYANAPNQDRLLIQKTTSVDDTTSLAEVFYVSLSTGNMNKIYEYPYNGSIDALPDNVLVELAKIDARIFDTDKVYLNLPEGWSQNTYGLDFYSKNYFGLGPYQNKVIDIGKVLRLQLDPEGYDNAGNDQFKATAYLFKYNSESDTFQQKIVFKGKIGSKCIPYVLPNQTTGEGENPNTSAGFRYYQPSQDYPYLTYTSSIVYTSTFGSLQYTGLFVSNATIGYVCDMVLVQ